MGVHGTGAKGYSCYGLPCQCTGSSRRRDGAQRLWCHAVTAGQTSQPVILLLQAPPISPVIFLLHHNTQGVFLLHHNAQEGILLHHNTQDVTFLLHHNTQDATFLLHHNTQDVIFLLHHNTQEVEYDDRFSKDNKTAQSYNSSGLFLLILAKVLTGCVFLPSAVVMCFGSGLGSRS